MKLGDMRRGEKGERTDYRKEAEDGFINVAFNCRVSEDAREGGRREERRERREGI